MNRHGFSAAAAAAAAARQFFWGPRGTPFVDAANAWWWALDCLDARAENRRENAGLRIGRPCEPDDVVNALLRMDLPPTHARTVMAWGKKRDKPPAGTAARQYRDEVMARLTAGTAGKGDRDDARRGPERKALEIDVDSDHARTGTGDPWRARDRVSRDPGERAGDLDRRRDGPNQ